jgi:uncharacterized coiled-coil DUF342 family protein
VKVKGLSKNISFNLNGGYEENIEKFKKLKRKEMNDNNDSIDELYQNYWTIYSQMINKGHGPLEIAAILMAQSMSIYKTVLDSEEYDKMVDSISNMRYNVKELTPDQGHYH